MATYEISNYIKLLCIRIDHFESFIVAETNTKSYQEIEAFLERYDGRPGLKVIVVKMNSMEMISFDDVKKIIRNAHVFDYIRMLNSDGHEMIELDENVLSMRPLLKHMLNIE